MGDPWKSITPKGVQAFVNASIATLLVWLTVENHLSMVANSLVDLLSSKTFGLIVYYAIAVIILYKLLYNFTHLQHPFSLSHSQHKWIM